MPRRFAADINAARDIPDDETLRARSSERRRISIHRASLVFRNGASYHRRELRDNGGVSVMEQWARGESLTRDEIRRTSIRGVLPPLPLLSLGRNVGSFRARSRVYGINPGRIIRRRGELKLPYASESAAN